MKPFFHFIILGTIALAACSTNTEGPESTIQSGDSVVLNDAGEKATQYASYIKTLFGVDSLWLRGIGAGSSRTAIGKAMLPIAPDAQNGDTLFYLIQLEKIDAVDLEFIAGEAKGLKELNLYFYPKDKKAQEIMIKELSAYLDKRFGPRPEGSTLLEWPVENGKAKMSATDQGGVHDIALKFSSLHKTL